MLNEMFRHVSQRLGNKLEGVPDVPDNHQPQLLPAAAIVLFYPRLRLCIEGRRSLDPKNTERLWPSDYGIARSRWWPAITSLVAGDAMLKVKDLIDAKTALIILMESAIYASKYDLEANPHILDPLK